MAVIQPYFNPNLGRQSENFFTGYLNSFMSVRSKQNEQLMKHSLEKQSPAFLQGQLKLLNDNIALIEEGKVDIAKLEYEKAKTRSRANLQLLEGSHVRTARSGGGNNARERAENKARLDAEQVMKLIEDPSFEQHLFDEVKKQSPSVSLGLRSSGDQNLDTWYKMPDLEDEYGVLSDYAKDNLIEENIATWLKKKGMNLDRTDGIAKEIRENMNIGAKGESYNKAKLEREFKSGIMKKFIDPSSSYSKPRPAVPFDDDAARRIAEDSFGAAIVSAGLMNDASDREIKALNKKIAEKVKSYEDMMKDYDPYREFGPKGISNLMLNSPFIQSKDPARLREPRGASSPRPTMQEVDDELRDMEEIQKFDDDWEVEKKRIKKGLEDMKREEAAKEEEDFDFAPSTFEVVDEEPTDEQVDAQIQAITDEVVEEEIENPRITPEEMNNPRIIPETADEIEEDKKEEVAKTSDLNEEELEREVREIINQEVKEADAEKPVEVPSEMEEKLPKWKEVREEGEGLLTTKFEPISRDTTRLKRLQRMMADIDFSPSETMKKDTTEPIQYDDDLPYFSIDSMEEMDGLQDSDLRTKNNSRIKPEYLKAISEAVGYNPKSNRYGGTAGIDQVYAIDSEYMNGLLKHLKSLSPEEKEKAYDILEKDLEQAEAYPVWNFIFNQKKPGDSINFE